MKDLRAKIEESGITITKLAEKLGLSREGLYLKLNGTTEFKASEIVLLREILRLTKEEQERFFFANHSE